MRKLGCLCLLGLCCMSMLFSANSQKLYMDNDNEYRAVVVLCSMSGVLGPSSSTPVTARELQLALDRVDVSQLPLFFQQLYEDTYAVIFDKDIVGFKADLDIAISPQVFLSTDYFGKASDGNGRNYFFLPYRDEKPSINFVGEFFFGRNVFLEGALPIINSPLKDGLLITSFDWLLNYREGRLNFLGRNNTGMASNVPILARGAFGNDYFNIILGRSQHGMGAGFTGNMIVGNNFPYQEIFKIGFLSNPFTYNISYTHFDTQKGLLDFERPRFGGEHQIRLVHRFDVNIIDKLRIVLNLGTLYFTDSTFDIRLFTPFMMAHNYFNYDEDFDISKHPYDEANNILGIEVEWAIMPRLNMNMQVVVDQFQLFFEDQDALPMACGGLINLCWTEPLANSSLRIWLEGVYTTPFLYLNEKYNSLGGDQMNKSPNYNYDFIVGYYRADWQAPNISYSGYTYGPDCIAVTIGTQYKNYQAGVSSSLSLAYRIHGEKGIDDPIFGNSFKDVSTPTGIPEHTIQLQGDCSWAIIKDKLDLFGGIGLSYYINFCNQNDVNKFLPQGYVGITWQVL